MTALKGYIMVTRPANMLICGMSVLCGGIIGDRPLTLVNEFITSLSHGIMPSWAVRLVFGAISASLILAAGNVLNDICDVPTDRINAPHRPITSGMISPGSAAFYASILTLAGLVTAAPLGIPGIAVAVTASLLLAAYNIRLKRVPLAGNIIVAVLGGMAFIYGGIAGACVSKSFVPASFAMLYHLGRELLKDAADIRGDLSAGIRTAATVWGVQTACRLASVVLLLLAFVVTIPCVTGLFGYLYTLLVVFGVCPVLIYSSVSAIRDPSETNLRRVSTHLKADMPVGIIAVLAGFQGW